MIYSHDIKVVKMLYGLGVKIARLMVFLFRIDPLEIYGYDYMNEYANDMDIHRPYYRN